MKKPQSDVYDSFSSVWREYIQGLEDSLDKLEKDIQEASEMSEKCTSEWCTATEHVINELSDSLFGIHEPKFSSDQDSAKLKTLKKRVHDLYAQYKSVIS